MKNRLFSLTAAVLGLAFSATASAQLMSGFASPLQRSFWGYVGVTMGRVDYDYPCTAGFICDREANAIRLFAGGRFNNWLGLEGSLLGLGQGQVAGGEVDAKGGNVSLLAGLPVGANSTVFGKIGVTYARTEVKGAGGGLANGTENSFGPSIGFGAQFGLTDRVAFRLDIDRQRLNFKNFGRDNIDTAMLGLQVNF